jgi:hypothetical protein
MANKSKNIFKLKKRAIIIIWSFSKLSFIHSFIYFTFH